MKGTSIIVFVQFPAFSHDDIFTLHAQSFFKQDAVREFAFPFKGMYVIPNRLPIMFSFTLLLSCLFQFTLLNELRKFLDTILYIKSILNYVIYAF